MFGFDYYMSMQTKKNYEEELKKADSIDRQRKKSETKDLKQLQQEKKFYIAGSDTDNEAKLKEIPGGMFLMEIDDSPRPSLGK